MRSSPPVPWSPPESTPVVATLWQRSSLRGPAVSVTSRSHSNRGPRVIGLGFPLSRHTRAQSAGTSRFRSSCQFWTITLCRSGSQPSTAGSRKACSRCGPSRTPVWPVRSINLRLAAIKKLVTEAADNAQRAPEVAAPIGRVRGAQRQGVRAGTCRIWWKNYNSIWAVHRGAEACRMGRLKQRSPEEVSSHRAGSGRLCAVSGPGRTHTPRCQTAQGTWRPCSEVVSRHDGDTYPAVYTVRFNAAVYVPARLQEEGQTGQRDTEAGNLVKRRLRVAEQHYTDTYGNEGDQ